MKSKYVILASALLISAGSFAQKDELKTLKKIYEKDIPSAKDVIEYKAKVVQAEPLIGSASESDKVYFEFYKANVPFVEMTEQMAKPENQANPEAALKFFTPAVIANLAENSEKVIEFEKTSGKQLYTKKIDASVSKFRPMLLNYAIGLGDQKRPKDAASVLYSIYKLDKKDQEKLYYAASYAVNGEDYPTALKYYEELKQLNYSGEKTLYAAKSKASGSVDYFNTKSERDMVIKLTTHSDPTEEKQPSRRGEIYKNIALIYVQDGKTEEAKKAIVDARKQNPEDSSLIITEADLYLKSKDYANYERLVKEVLEKNPNDAVLQYNLGVIASQGGKDADAEKYYLKAIQIDPKYTDAYTNLAIIKLAPESALIDQMNKLGTSPADNKKYDILKKQRLDIFNSAIPYLEKAVELNPKNYQASKTLLNVYNALEITDKAAPLKVKVKEMEATMK